MRKKKWPYPRKKVDYKRALAETEKLSDGLNYPVDSQIKPLVAALRMYGVRTKCSCQGHPGRGENYPYVDVDYRDAYVAGRLICNANVGHCKRSKSQRREREKREWVFVPYASWLRLKPRDTSFTLPTMQRRAKELARKISGE